MIIIIIIVIIITIIAGPHGLDPRAGLRLPPGHPAGAPLRGDLYEYIYIYIYIQANTTINLPLCTIYIYIYIYHIYTIGALLVHARPRALLAREGPRVGSTEVEIS